MGGVQTSKFQGGHNTRDGDVKQERAGRASIERDEQAEAYDAACVPFRWVLPPSSVLQEPVCTGESVERSCWK